jgi:hypothetical protein
VFPLDRLRDLVDAYLALRDMAAQSADPTMKGLATLSLVPRTVAAALKARAGA